MIGHVVGINFTKVGKIINNLWKGQPSVSREFTPHELNFELSMWDLEEKQ